MAVVSSVSVEGAERVNQRRYPVVEIMEIRGEIVEEDKVFVAAGKNMKESKSTLLWALHNSGGRQICILHVHQPAEKIPIITKLSDFGVCCVLSQNELSSNNTSFCCRTDPKGTFVYMDLEFLSTGELTSKSDTYSFGIILLRLLTGRPALGLTKEVQCTLNEENLKNILDPTAGDWPFVQAQQLALLAMSCCDPVRKKRPDLASEVSRVLDPMRFSCRLSSSVFGSERHYHIPHYFICPIFQEVMQDPVVAADGCTYEAETLKRWLDSGHNTSPMTNLELANSNLVPNHALRSAIQEWLQKP